MFFEMLQSWYLKRFVSPMKTTGGQCFLLWEQHLVLDGKCTDVLKRRVGYAILCMFELQFSFKPCLEFTPSCSHVIHVVAYHTDSQISYP